MLQPRNLIVIEENAQAEKKRGRVKTRSKDIKSADFIEKQDVNEGDAGQLLENDVPGSEDDRTDRPVN